MTGRHAPVAPTSADRRELPPPPAAHAPSLPQAIGNRAFAARAQTLARKLGGHHNQGQLIKGEKGELYEILRSDFDDFMGDWRYRVKGADGKEQTIGDWESGYDFSSATQLIEAAAADDKKAFKPVIDAIPEHRLHELAGFTAWLDKIQPLLTPERFAYMAAGIMLVSRHAPAARKEAMRQISAELGDKDVAMRMIKKPVQAVIVPRDKQMTELDEFKSLMTSDSGAGPGKTFDGREWSHVRGVGDVRVGTKVYAAITEENILGGAPDPKIFEERKDKTGAVVVPKGTAQGGYTTGYSTTTHEFAHVLHRHGLSAEDRKRISKCYAARRAASTGSAAKLVKQWVDGPRVSPVAPKNWKDAGWTDKKWLAHLAGLSDDARRPYECYASQTEEEYFAQLSNAYLGTNLGNDPTTGRPRKNGRAWIKANEPKEMLELLDRLYARKTVNDIKSDGKLVAGGKCANPAPKPPPSPPPVPGKKP